MKQKRSCTSKKINDLESDEANATQIFAIKFLL